MVRKENVQRHGNSLLQTATSKRMGPARFASLVLRGTSKHPIKKVKVQKSDESRVSDLTGSIMEEIRPATIKEVADKDVESSILGLSVESGDSENFSLSKAFAKESRTVLGESTKFTPQPSAFSPPVKPAAVPMQKKSMEIQPGIKISAPSPMSLDRIQVQKVQEHAAPASEEYEKQQREARMAEEEAQKRREQELAKIAAREKKKEERQNEIGQGFEAQLEDLPDPLKENEPGVSPKKSLVNRILGKIRPKSPKKSAKNNLAPMTAEEARALARKAIEKSKGLANGNITETNFPANSAGNAAFPIEEIMTAKKDDSVSDLDSSARKGFPIKEVLMKGDEQSRDDESISTLGTAHILERMRPGPLNPGRVERDLRDPTPTNELEDMIARDGILFNQGPPGRTAIESGGGLPRSGNALIDQMDSGTLTEDVEAAATSPLGRCIQPGRQDTKQALKGAATKTSSKPFGYGLAALCVHPTVANDEGSNLEDIDPEREIPDAAGTTELQRGPNGAVSGPESPSAKFTSALDAAISDVKGQMQMQSDLGNSTKSSQGENHASLDLIKTEDGEQNSSNIGLTKTFSPYEDENSNDDMHGGIAMNLALKKTLSPINEVVSNIDENEGLSPNHESAWSSRDSVPDLEENETNKPKEFVATEGIADRHNVPSLEDDETAEEGKQGIELDSVLGLPDFDDFNRPFGDEYYRQHRQTAPKLSEDISRKDGSESIIDLTNLASPMSPSTQDGVKGEKPEGRGAFSFDEYMDIAASKLQWKNDDDRYAIEGDDTPKNIVVGKHVQADSSGAHKIPIVQGIELEERHRPTSKQDLTPKAGGANKSSKPVTEQNFGAFDDDQATGESVQSSFEVFEHPEGEVVMWEESAVPKVLEAQNVKPRGFAGYFPDGLFDLLSMDESVNRGRKKVPFLSGQPSSSTIEPGEKIDQNSPRESGVVELESPQAKENAETDLLDVIFENAESVCGSSDKQKTQRLQSFRKNFNKMAKTASKQRITKNDEISDDEDDDSKDERSPHHGGMDPSLGVMCGAVPLYFMYSMQKTEEAAHKKKKSAKKQSKNRESGRVSPGKKSKKGGIEDEMYDEPVRTESTDSNQKKAKKKKPHSSSAKSSPKPQDDDSSSRVAEVGAKVVTSPKTTPEQDDYKVLQGQHTTPKTRNIDGVSGHDDEPSSDQAGRQDYNDVQKDRGIGKIIEKDGPRGDNANGQAPNDADNRSERSHTQHRETVLLGRDDAYWDTLSTIASTKDRSSDSAKIGGESDSKPGPIPVEITMTNKTMNEVELVCTRKQSENPAVASTMGNLSTMIDDEKSTGSLSERLAAIEALNAQAKLEEAKGSTIPDRFPQQEQVIPSSHDESLAGRLAAIEALNAQAELEEALALGNSAKVSRLGNSTNPANYEEMPSSRSNVHYQESWSSRKDEPASYSQGPSNNWTIGRRGGRDGRDDASEDNSGLLLALSRSEAEDQTRSHLSDAKMQTSQSKVGSQMDTKRRSSSTVSSQNSHPAVLTADIDALHQPRQSKPRGNFGSARPYEGKQTLSTPIPSSLDMGRSTGRYEDQTHQSSTPSPPDSEQSSRKNTYSSSHGMSVPGILNTGASTAGLTSSWKNSNRSVSWGFEEIYEAPDLPDSPTAEGGNTAELNETFPRSHEKSPRASPKGVKPGTPPAAAMAVNRNESSASRHYSPMMNLKTSSPATLQKTDEAAGEDLNGAVTPLSNSSQSRGQPPESVPSTPVAVQNAPSLTSVPQSSHSSNQLSDEEEQELISRTLELSKQLLSSMTAQDLEGADDEVLKSLLSFGTEDSAARLSLPEVPTHDKPSTIESFKKSQSHSPASAPNTTDDYDRKSEVPSTTSQERRTPTPTHVRSLDQRPQQLATGQPTISAQGSLSQPSPPLSGSTDVPTSIGVQPFLAGRSTEQTQHSSSGAPSPSSVRSRQLALQSTELSSPTAHGGSEPVTYPLGNQQRLSGEQGVEVLASTSRVSSSSSQSAKADSTWLLTRPLGPVQQQQQQQQREDVQTQTTWSPASDNVAIVPSEITSNSFSPSLNAAQSNQSKEKSTEGLGDAVVFGAPRVTGPTTAVDTQRTSRSAPASLKIDGSYGASELVKSPHGQSASPSRHSVQSSSVFGESLSERSDGAVGEEVLLEDHPPQSGASARNENFAASRSASLRSSRPLADDMSHHSATPSRRNSNSRNLTAADSYAGSSNAAMGVELQLENHGENNEEIHWLTPSAGATMLNSDLTPRSSSGVANLLRNHSEHHEGGPNGTSAQITWLPSAADTTMLTSDDRSIHSSMPASPLPIASSYHSNAGNSRSNQHDTFGRPGGRHNSSEQGEEQEITWLPTSADTTMFSSEVSGHSAVPSSLHVATSFPSVRNRPIEGKMSESSRGGNTTNTSRASSRHTDDEAQEYGVEISRMPTSADTTLFSSNAAQGNSNAGGLAAARSFAARLSRTIAVDDSSTKTSEGSEGEELVYNGSNNEDNDEFGAAIATVLSEDTKTSLAQLASGMSEESPIDVEELFARYDKMAFRLVEENTELKYKAQMETTDDRDDEDIDDDQGNDSTMDPEVVNQNQNTVPGVASAVGSATNSSRLDQLRAARAKALSRYHGSHTITTTTNSSNSNNSTGGGGYPSVTQQSSGTRAQTTTTTRVRDRLSHYGRTIRAQSAGRAPIASTGSGRTFAYHPAAAENRSQSAERPIRAGPPHSAVSSMYGGGGGGDGSGSRSMPTNAGTSGPSQSTGGRGVVAATGSGPRGFFSSPNTNNNNTRGGDDTTRSFASSDDATSASSSPGGGLVNARGDFVTSPGGRTAGTTTSSLIGGRFASTSSLSPPPRGGTIGTTTMGRGREYASLDIGAGSGFISPASPEGGGASARGGGGGYASSSNAGGTGTGFLSLSPRGNMWYSSSDGGGGGHSSLEEYRLYQQRLQQQYNQQLETSSTASDSVLTTPSMKARELRRQLDEALQASKNIRKTQEQLGQELRSFKDRFYQKNDELEDQAMRAMGGGGGGGARMHYY